MRFFLLACLLPLSSAPARAQNGEFTEQRFHAMVRELLPWTRNIQENSRLSTARGLALQPPWEAPIKSFYVASAPRADFDCAKAKAYAADFSGMFSVDCGDDDTPGSYGAIVAGTNVWGYATVKGKVDPDRLAFAVGHEIGHIRLKHGAQYWVLYDQLKAKWMKGPGAALRDWRRPRELARYTPDAKGNYSAEDLKLVEADLAQYLDETFMEQNATSFKSWGNEKEDEADDYGARLAKAAGYDPGSAAGLFTDIDVDTFWLDFTTVDGTAPTSGEVDPAVKSHSSSALRDWRLMERYTLGTQGKNKKRR